MSKALPVYDLGQWIKSDRNIGYVVARMSAANEWEVRDDYKGREEVERFKCRGAGYVIQWVELKYTDTDAKPGDYSVTATTPRRLNWLMATTIAEKRYQPCDNPVKVPATIENPLPDPNPSVHWACPPDAALEASFDTASSQPALPLDIEARWCGGAEQVVEAMATMENAAVDIMRAVVAAGKKAEDWLIAKGLTP